MSEIKRLAKSQNGPESLMVKNDKLIQKLKNIILNYWTERKNDHFPAPQPVSLERRDLFKIKKFPYLVCVKSDGMRFLMLCTTVNGVGKCYMVDRAFRFYEVKQTFKDPIYRNTLFDGELIECANGRWKYIIHDCISYKGINMKQENFPPRYKCVVDCVTDCWSMSNESNFIVSLKEFKKFKDIGDLVGIMNGGELDHKTDGIIFTPINLPVGMNTQYTLFKWKPRELHTFDFKITIRDNQIFAQVNDERKMTDFASVSLDSDIGKKFHSQLLSLENFKDGAIVECDYDEVLKEYKPLFVRIDKTHPNGLFTVNKTLLNIRENITIRELIRLSQNEYNRT